jgi:hypothetical protein
LQDGQERQLSRGRKRNSLQQVERRL